MSFEKFLADFKARKPEWFREGVPAPANGPSVRQEAITVEPIKNKFASKTLSIGQQMDAELNKAWNEKVDFQKKAAGDWDGVEE